MKYSESLKCVIPPETEGRAGSHPIVLKSNRYSEELIGTVRLTPEAERVLRRIRARTNLPFRQIASEIIIQAESLIAICEED